MFKYSFLLTVTVLSGCWTNTVNVKINEKPVKINQPLKEDVNLDLSIPKLNNLDFFKHHLEKEIVTTPNDSVAKCITKVDKEFKFPDKPLFDKETSKLDKYEITSYLINHIQKLRNNLRDLKMKYYQCMDVK